VPEKVLIITYYWPPSGGAGVQRWVKFAKYLPEYGWEPVILTVDPRYAAYPVTDSTMESELPSSLKVYRTKATDYFSFYNKDRSKIPTAGFAANTDNSFMSKLGRFLRGNLFIPDPRRGWNKYAFSKACEIIGQFGIKHIITTSPPHSTQLIGLKLKKRFPEIKWIADLRDPWTDIYYYKQFYPTILSRAIDSSYEKKVLMEADKIIVVGESLKNLYSGKINQSDKFKVITNGYDEEDFQSNLPEVPSVFTITYVGTLSDIYPIEGFIEALEKFRAEGNSFIVRFIGMVSFRQAELLKSKLKDSELQFVPYVDHSRAIRYMLDSSVLLLIIPDHQSNKSIITGKIFEYLASGRPVICLGPGDGDAADIITFAKAGEIFEYDEVAGIAECIRRASENQLQGASDERYRFSRKNLTQRISEILKSYHGS
jgi:glycosyltransferase involved in cell wall biosynthesis